MISKLIQYKDKIFVYGLMLFLPIMGRAQGIIIVPCDGIDDPCGIEDVVELINNVIGFLLQMILPIAAVVFVVAGFLYMTSGDNPGRRKMAHNIFKNVAVGLLIVLAAWLIVFTLFNALGVEDYSYLDSGS